MSVVRVMITRLLDEVVLVFLVEVVLLLELGVFLGEVVLVVEFVGEVVLVVDFVDVFDLGELVELETLSTIASSDGGW